MKNNIKAFLSIGILFGCIATNLSAQDICNIKGHIADRSMRLSKEPIQKVYLNQMNESEQFIVVDSANIQPDGSFVFKFDMTNIQYPVIGHITGFDNGISTFWMEPGEIMINIQEARYPSAAQVTGTPTNELAAEYKKLRQQCIRTQTDFIKIASEKHGTEWLDQDEGIRQRTIIGNRAVLKQLGDEMTFILDHANSPFAPHKLQKEIMYYLDEFSLNRMMNAISPSLKNHPYYTSVNNAILAKFLKVGAQVPDIKLPTANGKEMKLSDLRGKYVLLDFWASWCGPCRKEIPFLIQLFNDTKEKRDKFTIVSFSIDNKEKAWHQAIAERGMNLEGWIHASDLKGWQSEQAQMFGVEAVPHTVLISPEGRVISFNLRGEEMVRTVKQLLET